MKPSRVLIMAGGTGGHVFPALAVAQALRARGAEVQWLGTRGRMEEKLVPRYDFAINYIDVRGIRRNGIWRKLTAPFMILRAMLQARAVLKRLRPEVVVGFGGYASGPGGMMAHLMGIPVVLHEQNAAAGLTNRMLSRIAKRILLGFPGAFTGEKVVVTGNPVRAEIAALHERERTYDEEGPLHLLILGGSLGAQALNELVPPNLKPLTVPIEVVHQCGEGQAEKTREIYAGAGFKYETRDFIDDMAKAYTWADLIICRAGALSCAEIAAAGLPAVLVPLPTAVDDHQTRNARVLEEAGGAVLLPQSDLTPGSLKEILEPILQSRQKLKAMAAAMRSQAVLDATDRAVAAIDAVVEHE